MFVSNLLILLLVGVLRSQQSTVGLPCDFFDSTNITDGIKQSDGSILFDGTRFSSDQYATVDYTFEKGIKSDVEQHIRGCVCHLKPCIRLCCPLGSFFDPTITTGSRCREDARARLFEGDVRDAKNQTNRVVLDDHFAYVHERTCQYYIPTDFDILHTGHLMIENNKTSHQEYCLAASNGGNVTTLDGLLCVYPPEPETPVMSYAMLTSVLFIIATLCVYIWIPEMRNLHGKCMMAYLISLACGFVFLAIIKIDHNVDPINCVSFGLLIYFAILSAFLWLNVTCVDLWCSFRASQGLGKLCEKTRFKLYVAYAWGLPLFVTCLAYIIDTTQVFSEDYRPGIGEETCFLRKNRLIQFIYLYLPICIICIVNIIIFVLTVRQVHLAQNKSNSNEEEPQLRKRLIKSKENLTLYIRLFILMGLTWSLEWITFLLPGENIFYFISDLCNSIQGVLIFVLIVLRKRVLRLIKKRWQKPSAYNPTRATIATNDSDSDSDIPLQQVHTPNQTNGNLNGREMHN